MADDVQRAAWRRYNQRRRERAAKAGICSTCLARPYEPGYKQCRLCRRKRRERAGA